MAQHIHNTMYSQSADSPYNTHYRNIKSSSQKMQCTWRVQVPLNHT